MKHLLLITIILLFSCLTAQSQNPRNKKYKPPKVQEVKLKKSKLPKQYRYNELTKRDKKQKSHKQGKIKCINLATYTNKSKRHYREASKKINPKFLCVPN